MQGSESAVMNAAAAMQGARAAQPGHRSAAPDALRHPVDVVEGLAVVESPRSLGESGRAMLEELAEKHPARAVRTAAGGVE